MTLKSANRYPAELRERVVRMLLEQREVRPLTASECRRILHRQHNKHQELSYIRPRKIVYIYI